MNDTQFVFDWFLGLLFWKRCTKSGWLFFVNVFLGDKSWEKRKSWIASSFFRWVGRIRVAFGSRPFKFLALLLWFNLLNLNRHYHIFKFIILIKKTHQYLVNFFVISLIVLAASGPAAPTVAEPAATWITQKLLACAQRHGCKQLGLLFACTLAIFRTNAVSLKLYNRLSFVLFKAKKWKLEHTTVTIKYELSRFEKLWGLHVHIELRFYRYSYWDPFLQKQLIVQFHFFQFWFDLQLQA